MNIWIGFKYLRIRYSDTLIRKNEISDSIKSRILLDHLSDYQLLKESFTYSV
jgi:hypothetical protein